MVELQWSRLVHLQSFETFAARSRPPGEAHAEPARLLRIASALKILHLGGLQLAFPLALVMSFLLYQVD